MRCTAVVTSCLLAACRGASNSASPLQLLFERALTLRDTAVLAQAVTPTLVFHARGGTDTVTRARLWQMAQPILTAFPDIRFRVIDEVRSGLKIAARVTFSGTQTGSWEGIPPTGRVVHVSEMFLCRLDQGRVAECWQEWDEYGLRQQLMQR